MSQSPPPTRVKGGPPLWLWGLLAIFTFAVVAGVISSSTPEDPQAIFEELNDRDNPVESRVFKAKLEKLRGFEDYDVHVNYLEGVFAHRERRDPRALALLARIPDDHELKAEALQVMGSAHRRVANFEESMRCYEQAVAKAPESSGKTRVALAEMYYGIGAQQLAEDTLNEAIEHDAELTSAYKTRALIKVNQKRFEEALGDFKRFLSSPGEFSASTPEMLSAYGTMIVEVGDEKLIEEAIDEYLDLFEESSQRVELLIAAKRFDEAKDALAGEGDAANLAPPTKKIALLLAIHNKDWETAEVLLTPLLETMPRDLKFFEMVASVYKATGNSERLAIAEENVKQLRELEAGVQAGLRKVGGNIDDAEGRIEVARLYLKLANYSKSTRWHALAARLDDQYSTEASDAVSGKGFPREPLVPFPAEEERSDDPSEEIPEKASVDEPATDPENKPEAAKAENVGRIESTRSDAGTSVAAEKN